MRHLLYTAQEKDYPELADVWEASVRATHDFLSEADIRFYKPLVLHEYLKTTVLFYTRDAAGDISGFVGTAGTKIEMLFIRPDARARGIGRALLLYAVREKGADTVDVNEQNAQAVGFYLHLGFRVTGRSEVDGTGKPFPILFMECGEDGPLVRAG